MQAQERHPFIIVECILGAVAMMNIPIDDEDAVSPVLLSHPGSDSNAVKETKPHAQLRCRMMARRSDKTEGSAIITPHHCLHCLATRPRCEQPHLEGSGTHEGIRFDLSSTLLASRLNDQCHLGNVDQFHFFGGEW
jgi:hypothetical protein